MRVPTYLRYSMLSLWEQDREAFYLRHLADAAQADQQSEYMAVGSAFDAYVKASLAKHYVLNDPRLEFETLFAEQVAEQHREFARPAGEETLDVYKRSGAYDDLLELIGTSYPHLESRTQGVIECHGLAVPFVGHPDLCFGRVGRVGLRFMLDWKVRGYLSSRNTSPSKFYLACRDIDGNTKQHPGFAPAEHYGIRLHRGCMAEINTAYADQLSIYGWLTASIGDEPGEFIACIEEIVGPPGKQRVATFRAVVAKSHQADLKRRIRDCWETIQSGYIFRELSEKDSRNRCEVLEEAACYQTAI